MHRQPQHLNPDAGAVSYDYLFLITMSSDEQLEEDDAVQPERPPEYCRKKRRDLLRSLIDQYVEHGGLVDLQEHIRRTYGVSVVFYDIHGLRFRGERTKIWELGSEFSACDIASVSGYSGSPDSDNFRIDFLDFLGKKDATRKLFSAFRRKVEEFRK
jgi:hypothetical protein